MLKKCYDKEKSAKLERLYYKYRLIMLSEAYNILFDSNEAEDAVQQAFLRISDFVEKIKEDDPAMTCNFLKVVTRNVAKDLYKKRTFVGTEEDIATKLEDNRPSRPAETSQIVIHKDSFNRIVDAIMNLPEIYRDVLLVEKVYGYSREDSMKILNENYETLKKRLTRAKIKLLEILKEEGLNDGRENCGKNAR